MEARAHERFMRLALGLASQAVGDTSPNPVVGALVVKAGRIVGRGYHRRAGFPHAETQALRQAGPRARGASLYVTLEPCAHTGRTPPCCDAVIAAGIKRVVVGMADPNPRTDGRGIRRLRRAGLQVITGVLEGEAKRLNAPFAKAVTKRLPWVIAKVAQSLDGKIATRTGASRWISSAESRAIVHRLRREVDAIVVGVNTVLRDDPLLSVRDRSKPRRPGRPIRVILDSHLRTPLSSRCLVGAGGASAIVATTARSVTKRAAFQRRGVEVWTFPAYQERVPLKRVLQELVRRHEVTSVLIEGGGELIASALAQRLVDRLVWFVAPLLIGGRASPSAVGGTGVGRLTEAYRLTDMVIRRSGPDLLVDARVVYPAP